VLLRVRESFSNIDKKVRETDVLVAEIALAAKEQAQGIEHIGTALDQLGLVTQNNASNAEVSASAAEEMNVQSGVHRELTVKLFALVDGSAGLEKMMKRNYTGEHQFSASASAKKSTGELQHRLRLLLVRYIKPSSDLLWFKKSFCIIPNIVCVHHYRILCTIVVTCKVWIIGSHNLKHSIFIDAKVF
jgi:hypothetical protein